jgi:8-oxo-dGTP diphosphatase
VNDGTPPWSSDLELGYISASMAQYLVRHAKAGSRSGWVGPDEARPLTRAGREQAEALMRALADRPVPRALSSPYRRCVETLQPLAIKLGVPVELVGLLAEGESAADVVELLTALPEESVLCSHGDVIPAVIDVLAVRGMAIEGEPDWRKGATWVLERDGDEFVRAHAIPPPNPKD